MVAEISTKLVNLVSSQKAYIDFVSLLFCFGMLPQCK